MALTTSLAGRVRNTTLPKSHSLLPLHEAVVNGLQAIDARFGEDVGRGRLTVRIERSEQEEFEFESTMPGRAPLKPITGFTIEDNGIGFTADHMQSFETLDTDFKSALGCRGVGRLVWLKAFDRVAIRSAFLDESTDLQHRHFKFTIAGEIEQMGTETGLVEPGSIVHLEGYKQEFQKSAPKSVDAIAREIFEHCIWYFIRPGGAPDVSIDDGELLSPELGHIVPSRSAAGL